MKNKTGITLVALIMTISILLILTTVTITIGTSEVNKTKLKAFYTKLEIAQEGVEKITQTNESYKDDKGQVISLKNLGGELTAEHKSLIKSLNASYDVNNFKFFTANQMEEELGISGVEMDLLVDFKDKIVINPQGLRIQDKTYYMLENKKNFIELNNEKNVGKVDFTYEIIQYTSDSYKVTVTPINIGDIKEGVVKYRRTGVEYWNVASNNEFIVNKTADYDIMYIDANGNSIVKEKIPITVTE